MIRHFFFVYNKNSHQNHIKTEINITHIYDCLWIAPLTNTYVLLYQQSLAVCNHVEIRSTISKFAKSLRPSRYKQTEPCLRAIRPSNNLRTLIITQLSHVTINLQMHVNLLSVQQIDQNDYIQHIH